MKYDKVLLVVIKSIAFFLVSFLVIYIFSFILKLFEPIPDGADMYRESTELALNTLPNVGVISIFSAIIGVSLGVVVGTRYKETINDSTGVEPFRKNIDCLSFQEEYQRKDEKVVYKHNKINHSDDWYDHSLEDHDSEDGWCTECEEFELQKEKIDTTTPTGQFMLTVFADVGQLERDYILARQKEGIEAKKARGEYKGRQPIDIDKSQFEQEYKLWKDGSITATTAMSHLGLKPNTFYRRVKKYENNK